MSIHGDNKATEEGVQVYCQRCGTVEVSAANWPINFRRNHNAATGCLPTLATADEAVELAYALAIRAQTDDVAAFWDRGWGDSGGVAEISVIVDGNGQNPRALLTPVVYKELSESGAIGPNVLTTFKARRVHQFQLPGAVDAW
ncbi:hypothetical protein [Saccharopolyspora griseoalba]|uniref:Uncharacterized protein n=1 Tax=Saccharopolyspora griseoalba TaxID=1431848 RepID=A0ABW2LQT2_9PSEU